MLLNIDECNLGNIEWVNEIRKEFYFKIEEYKDRKYRYMYEEVIRLGEIIDDFCGWLRVE